jgi:hypothetical protein
MCRSFSKAGEHQEQEETNEQNLAKYEHQPHDCLGGQDPGEKNHLSNKMRDPGKGGVLESYSKAEPRVILIEQSTHLSNVSAEEGRALENYFKVELRVVPI